MVASSAQFVEQKKRNSSVRFPSCCTKLCYNELFDFGFHLLQMHALSSSCLSGLQAKYINVEEDTVWLMSMAENAKSDDNSGVVTLPCGCKYQDKGWLLTRVSECENHKRRRTMKRPYRPKAECVRP